MWTRSWLSHHDKNLTLGQHSSSWAEILNTCGKPVLLVVVGGAPAWGSCLGEGLGVGEGGGVPENSETPLGMWAYVALFSLLCFHFSLSTSSHFDPFCVAFSSTDSPSHHVEIRRLFPRAQMHTVPNAGHWIHADCPQDFVAAIRGFLA